MSEQYDVIEPELAFRQQVKKLMPERSPALLSAYSLVAEMIASNEEVRTAVKTILTACAEVPAAALLWNNAILEYPHRAGYQQGLRAGLEMALHEIATQSEIAKSIEAHTPEKDGEKDRQ